MTAKKRLALFIFMDALGWEVVERHSFLGDFCPHRQPMETIFGYSSSCHPSIYTGLLPQEHGHFSFFIYDPANSPFWFLRPLALLPRALTSRARIRHLVSRATKRVLGYSGYFELYNAPFDLLPKLDFTEKRDLYQPGGINSGALTIFDRLRRSEVPFHMSDWRRPDQENIAEMLQYVSKGEIAWAELFLGKLDGLMHMQGPLGEQVGPTFMEYERKLGDVLRTAQSVYDQVHVYVYGDHGMTQVTRSLDLMATIKDTGLKWGREYAAVYDSTMARFWFLQPGAKETITSALGGIDCGAILSEDFLAQQGALFPGQRYGQLYFLVEPGVLIIPSFMGQKPIPGMHGYHPAHKDSMAALVGSSEPMVPVKRLDDMFRLMLAEAQWASGKRP